MTKNNLSNMLANAGIEIGEKEVVISVAENCDGKIESLAITVTAPTGIEANGEQEYETIAQEIIYI